MLQIIGCALIFFAVSFCIMILGCRTYTTNVKDNIKASNFVAAMGFLLAFYIISAFLIAIINNNLTTKILMTLFALSPFIIGPIATYENHKLYTYIQVLTILSSALYVIKIMI